MLFPTQINCLKIWFSSSFTFFKKIQIENLALYYTIRAVYITYTTDIGLHYTSVYIHNNYTYSYDITI